MQAGRPASGRAPARPAGAVARRHGRGPGAGAGAFDPTVPGSGRLAVGVTEFNPNFMWPIRARKLPAPFNRWRYEFQQLRPRMVRLVLDWPSLQPDAGMPANLDVPQTGCSRGTPPCLGWMGVREQLAAIAALQRERDVQVLTVVTGSPAWAASAPAGCERPTETARSRPPREDAMSAYQQLVKDVAAGGAPRGRGAALVDAVERARPSVLHLAAARGLRGHVAVAVDRAVPADGAQSRHRARGGAGRAAAA